MSEHRFNRSMYFSSVAYLQKFRCASLATTTTRKDSLIGNDSIMVIAVAEISNKGSHCYLIKIYT